MSAIEWLKSTGEFETMSIDEIANYICENLKGSCQSLGSEDMDWLEETNKLEFLDSVVFECPSCGWWYEVCEMSIDTDTDEDVCEDCSNE